MVESGPVSSAVSRAVTSLLFKAVGVTNGVLFDPVTLFETVNLSFWKWSIGFASRSCVLCAVGLREGRNPGKLDLNPKVRGQLKKSAGAAKFPKRQVYSIK